METAPDAQDLLSQARSGDPEAFCELCRTYETRLLRQATALCGNPSNAEDLAQETLLEAWKSLRRYNGRCQFFTWLCAILLNRYRNTFRKKRILSFSDWFSRDEEPESSDRLMDENSSPAQAAQANEEGALVRACIQALPPKHQQVIFLRFYVDDSLGGIAEALGCSVGTVKSRLFHALEKLRTVKVIRAQKPNSKVDIV